MNSINIQLLICKGWGSINPEGDEWGPVLKQEYATLWSNKECDHTYHHGWVTDRYICKKVIEDTGCSLNIVFFTLKFCDFSELCQFCCSAGVLPAWRVYTH